MQIYFLSAEGNRIDFDGRTYGISEMNIFQHQLSYDTKNGKIINFKRDIIEREIEINISDDAVGTWQEHYEYIQDIFDRDNFNNERGKLFVNGYYLMCNIYAGEVEDQFRNWCDFQTCVLKIVSDYPVWIKETTCQYLPEKPNPVEYATLEKGILFPEFPFDFYSEKGEKTLFNPSFKDSNFILTIYGFAENPQITIAGHPYRVETTVYEGERLVIDSIKRTVKKIGRLGDIADRYNARGKEKRVFQKIPPGTNTFQWSGGFGVDITLFDERSEPKWNL